MAADFIEEIDCAPCEYSGIPQKPFRFEIALRPLQIRLFNEPLQMVNRPFTVPEVFLTEFEISVSGFRFRRLDTKSQQTAFPPDQIRTCSHR